MIYRPRGMQMKHSLILSRLEFLALANNYERTLNISFWQGSSRWNDILHCNKPNYEAEIKDKATKIEQAEQRLTTLNMELKDSAGYFKCCLDQFPAAIKESN
ncbi:hypothetical protein Tco_1411732 [Tanacetum coccineum]